MMLQLLSCVGLLGGPQVEWKAPSSYIAGQPFNVKIHITAPDDGTVVSSWLMTPAAFTVDGKPLAKREDKGTVELPPGFQLTGSVDLGPMIEAGADFELGYANEIAEGDPISVRVLEKAEAGLNFMEMPEEDLTKYQVLLQTSRGDILLDLWPDVAPGHVRNFLDLSYTNFYDGTVFHRVIQGFMIQGGDPTASGRGNGPRTLKAEFNDRPHLPGTLSMARTNDPDSASCQFFIVHQEARHLDNQYTAFGRLSTGADVVDAIATTKVVNQRPVEEQTVLRAIVVKKGAEKEGE